jgi:hypothetical protein
MRANSESLRTLELSKVSSDPVEAQALETEMGFGYRLGFGYCQAIGELIFVMAVGRIDISYPIIKITILGATIQGTISSSQAHFIYLNVTRDHSLTY